MSCLQMAKCTYQMFNNAIYKVFVTDEKGLVNTMLSIDGIPKEMTYFLYPVNYFVEFHLGDTGWKLMSRHFVGCCYVGGL